MTQTDRAAVEGAATALGARGAGDRASLRTVSAGRTRQSVPDVRRDARNRPRLSRSTLSRLDPYAVRRRSRGTTRPTVSSLRPTANEPVGRALASIESEVRELREFQSRWMMYLDPPDHTRLRSLVSRAFTAATVADMRGRIQALVNELLAPAREAGKLDVVQDLARPLPALVIADLIGMPREDRKTFQAWSDGIAAGMVLSTRGQDAIDGLKEAHRSQRELIAYFGTLVASRRVQPREDLLSALIASEARRQHPR